MAPSLVYFSYGFRKLKFLNILLNKDLIKYSRKVLKIEAVICWGFRPSSKKAINFAKTRQLPCWYLEDGFLRSFYTGDLSPVLALIVDETGIYYESLHPCKLETLLNQSFVYSIYQLTQIVLSQTTILNFKLSKYNHAPNLNDGLLRVDDKFRALVVDQTYGDMSVVCGGASEESFCKMLDRALLENPSGTIYIKTHPEVTSGRKKGYLTHIQDNDRIVMIRDNINPIDLIQRMDKVYVVTSQMGFEALMCGKPVVCFGVPWYAGWGLTDDRVKESPAWARRTKKRTVDELFAAAYIHYTRYLNPFTHKRGEIMDVINWLILQKKMAPNPFIRDFSNTNV